MPETESHDPFDLERFCRAQDHDDVYQDALEEMRSGYKATHWMWYVFPQIAGLGQSQMSQLYAISDIREARAFLEHPVLGPRLIEITNAIRATRSTDPVAIMGAVDAVKLRSSMTLFLRASPEPSLFQEVLDQFFKGETDPLTGEILDSKP